ncbi:MAG: ATP-binding protein, partial [Paracoccaceae bacterium]|nr:ATP-binding protein [Paracoccaceae bacterium]
LSTSPEKSVDTVLVIDVGTNAEILLGNKNKLMACSSPTGPAFEGAQISCGQRAAPGAIENVRIDPISKKVKFKVIGSDYWSDDKKFWSSIEQFGITGVCGSGIIEAIAEMRIAGIVDENGLIGSEEQTGTNLCIVDGRTQAFTLFQSDNQKEKIVVTNSDVRAIQLAKAALFAGSKLLMEELQVERVDRIILAGAFGAHISPKHAMVLGMIPDCNLKNVISAGNAAGTGARIALLNKESRRKVELLVNRISKIETAMASNFQSHFVAASAIPNSIEKFPELNNIVTLPKINFNQRNSRRSKKF